jgi:hypothetical protein
MRFSIFNCFWLHYLFPPSFALEAYVVVLGVVGLTASPTIGVVDSVFLKLGLKGLLSLLGPPVPPSLLLSLSYLFLNGFLLKSAASLVACFNLSSSISESFKTSPLEIQTLTPNTP